jgi:hypothetical protein
MMLSSARLLDKFRCKFDVEAAVFLRGLTKTPRTVLGHSMTDLAPMYLEQGRSFLDAANTLIEAKQSTLDIYHPLSNLLLFSIEISLKAALHSVGAPVHDGHLFDDYLIAAI